VYESLSKPPGSVVQLIVPLGQNSQEIASWHSHSDSLPFVAGRCSVRDPSPTNSAWDSVHYNFSPMPVESNQTGLGVRVAYSGA
jgi:hypothetical protein